ncbi:MAG TPA: L,D-transpeptidase [Parachlamydiaceae bacterium]|nr:L,D-transpeptidase [Parachlamydiaceae bacterium]
MSFPKLLSIFAGVLFSIIALAALIKSGRNSASTTEIAIDSPQEIEISSEMRTVVSTAPAAPPVHSTVNTTSPVITTPKAPLPTADRIKEFFNKAEPKFPIVQTVTYKSRVSWQKGRPAWLSDYASHYATSRHFIARSLNGKADYLKQDVAEGGRFNVLHPDKNIAFHLLIDTSRSKMWFYYIDLDANERVLVKTYTVGLGRIDSTKSSGMLTPLGKYSLGDKVAIYKPKMTGFYAGQKVELIRVFGTRWIPFDKEIGECTASPEGFGIHGVPWTIGDRNEAVEITDSLGKYESDGCIRLSTQDIEEIFAIIITRPTTIELVKDFYEAKLPGVERAGS